MLEQSYRELNKNAAVGVDSVTYEEYGRNLQDNLINLEQRLKQKRYRAKLVRRAFIPKSNGEQRPLGIPALEDKIVQNLARRILEALYEPLFADCSYAYRPNLSARQAVEKLQEQLRHKFVWVVEADIRKFFDSINHEILIQMLEKRVNDQAFIRLIRKWLNAGVLNADGSVEQPTCGTPQGGIVSPILANIYLHYALDLWYKNDIEKRSGGESLFVRYADDFVAAFRYHKDAASFYRRLKTRLKKFSLDVAEEKTRKLMFNRFRKEASETFSFLGFEFRWVKTRRGIDTVRVTTSPKRLQRIAAEFTAWCKKHCNRRIAWIMGMVKAKLMGLRNYFGVPGNSIQVRKVYSIFKLILYRRLNRRSERRSYNWKTFMQMWDYFNVSHLQRLNNEGIQLSFAQYLR